VRAATTNSNHSLVIICVRRVGCTYCPGHALVEQSSDLTYVLQLHRRPYPLAIDRLQHGTGVARLWKTNTVHSPTRTVLERERNLWIYEETTKLSYFATPTPRKPIPKTACERSTLRRSSQSRPQNPVLIYPFVSTPAPTIHLRHHCHRHHTHTHNVAFVFAHNSDDIFNDSNGSGLPFSIVTRSVPRIAVTVRD
jgi:hypothetical protein